MFSFGHCHWGGGGPGGLPEFVGPFFYHVLVPKIGTFVVIIIIKITIIIIRVTRRHDPTNKKTVTMTFGEHPHRATLETLD